MTKWKTLKDLPGIKAGTISDHFYYGLEHGSEEIDPSLSPDFFERVEDESEFVDVEIEAVDGVFTLRVPGQAGWDYIDVLPRYPEFVGFVYKGGKVSGFARMYADDDGDAAYDHTYKDETNHHKPCVPTHARFRRQK